MNNLSAKETLAILYPKWHTAIFQTLRICGSVELFLNDGQKILLLREICKEEGLHWGFQPEHTGYSIKIRRLDRGGGVAIR